MEVPSATGSLWALAFLVGGLSGGCAEGARAMAERELIQPVTGLEEDERSGPASLGTVGSPGPASGATAADPREDGRSPAAASSDGPARAASCGADGDGDGVCDDADECPEDGNKTRPGVCGCGATDTDSDGDGALDCDEECPDDGDKTEPGACGCGAPDADSDGDGTLDCEEECPEDPDRTTPDVCGCLGAPAGAGTSCDYGICPGTATCNADGTCGTPADCEKPGGVGCGDPIEHAGHVYYRCTGNRTWNEARAACQSAFGFDLARIDGAEEGAFVLGLGNSDAWIGGRGDGQGSYAWVLDGDDFWEGGQGGFASGSAFTDWDGNEPNDSGRCVALVDGDGWADGPCSTELDFICELVDDACPDDDAKLRPGVCGCGVADDDTDGDGTPDCEDACPEDPDKTEPDACGCVGNDAPAAAGTACSDPACILNTTCDGAGTCGRPDACERPASDCGQLLEHDGHGYWLCTGNRSWRAGRSLCQSVGMELVRVDSEEENAFIRGLNANPIWLGGYHAGGQVWRWSVDDSQFWSGGSGGSGTLFSKWASGEPDASGTADQCAYIDDVGAGTWVDTDCDGQTDILCESTDP